MIAVHNELWSGNFLVYCRGMHKTISYLAVFPTTFALTDHCTSIQIHNLVLGWKHFVPLRLQFQQTKKKNVHVYHIVQSIVQSTGMQALDGQF